MWAPRAASVKPSKMWSMAHSVSSKAIARGSPNRSPGARWPSWTLGSTTCCNHPSSGAVSWPPPRAWRKGALTAAPVCRHVRQLAGVENLDDPEIVRVVDRGLDPQRRLLFEVGLDLGGLVAGLDAGMHPP